MSKLCEISGDCDELTYIHRLEKMLKLCDISSECGEINGD